MSTGYQGVTTRFLCDHERLMLSDEKDMPLVLEAKDFSDVDSLVSFLKNHSPQLMQDVATYGAILFRGFAIDSDTAFEKALLSIDGLQGIRNAFMAEAGRTHAGNSSYVLQTNAIYKTGGTLYLGGFHSENYYNPDVPAYIGFCCLQPSLTGGETGLVNTEKVYEELSPELKKSLEERQFFVSRWLLQDVANRYHISVEKVRAHCETAGMPIIGDGDDACVLMYKPNVFEHPITKKRALQINFFEIETLNPELRRCFRADYKGDTWFWHRLIWQLPEWSFKTLEYAYMITASTIYSPKAGIKNVASKWKTYQAGRKLPKFDAVRVGSCFDKSAVRELAQSMRRYYSSCLWKKGDILFVDNRKVAHAGMPGSGPRLLRALIANPMNMSYGSDGSGVFQCQRREGEGIGVQLNSSGPTHDL